jgi:hypothetical protein
MNIPILNMTRLYHRVFPQQQPVDPATFPDDATVPTP